jgi:hypothetical protein
MVKGIRVVVIGDKRVALQIDSTPTDMLVLDLHPAVALALGQSLQVAAQEAWQSVYAVPQVEIVRHKEPTE